MAVLLLVPVVVLVINWFAAKQFYKIAEMKGHPEKKYFWWCFWLGITGWLMVVALPDRKNTSPNTVKSSDELPDL